MKEDCPWCGCESNTFGECDNCGRVITSDIADESYVSTSILDAMLEDH